MNRQSENDSLTTENHENPIKKKPYNGAAKQIGFIVGTGRCGTTILASVLNAHSKICVPPELSFLVGCYGENLLFEKFITGEAQHFTANDFIELIRQSSPYHLEDFIDLEQHFSEIDYPITSLTEVVKDLYDDICFRQSKEVFLEQTTWYGLELHSIQKIFPESKVIHIVRDGRDVAISAHRSGWWGMGVMENLERWAKEVNRIRRYGLDYPEYYYELKYEDLVNRPEYELRKLLEFLNLEFERNMLSPQHLVYYFDLLKKKNTNCYSLEYNRWREHPDHVFFRGSVYSWKANKKYDFSSSSMEVNKTLIDLGYEWNADGIEVIEKEACNLKIRAQERRRQIEVLSRPVVKEVKDGIGRPLTCHILDPQAPWLGEGSVVHGFPGMITDEEKKYYIYIGGFYSGQGAIVELGPWLGCSTIHLLLGLKRNPNFHNKKLHVVDDFIWRSAWMDPYYSGVDRPANGKSFRNLFDKFTIRFRDHMEVFEAKILPMADNAHLPQFCWEGGPIELCIIDCGRNFLVNEAWYQLLVDAFIPGKTLIVLQDWQTHKEIPERWWNQLKNFTDSKEGTFQIVHEVSEGGIATFHYKGGKRSFYDLNLTRNSISSVLPADTEGSPLVDSQGTYNEIRFLIENQQFQDALDALQHLLAKDPQFAPGWNDLGFLLYAAGQKEKAREAYKRAVQLAPEDPVARKNLADIYFIEERRYDEALQHYQKVISINPDDIEALVAVAYLYHEIGRIKEAMSLLKKALALEPGRAEACALYEKIRNLEDNDPSSKSSSPRIIASVIVAGEYDPKRIAHALGTIRVNTDPQLVEVMILCNPRDSSSEVQDAFQNARAAGLRVNPVDTAYGIQESLIRAVAEAKGKHLIFMFAGVILTENWLAPLLEAIEGKDDVGAVSPKVASLMGTLLEAGCSILEVGQIQGVGEGESLNDPAWNYVCDTPGVSRHMTLITREAWSRSGGFSSGCEDFRFLLLELGAAIRKSGFRLIYQPQCTIVLDDSPSNHGSKRASIRPCSNVLSEKERPEIPASARFAANPVVNSRSSVLVAGVFPADQPRNAIDTIQILSESNCYTVVQRWIQIGESPSLTLPATIEVDILPKPAECLIDLIRRRTLSQIPLDPYEYVIVILGDMLLPVGFLDTFLNLQKRFGFALAHPALASESPFHHPLLARCPGLDVREVGALFEHPLLSLHRMVFPAFLSRRTTAFEHTEETALWIPDISEEKFSVGVIDAVPVEVIKAASNLWPISFCHASQAFRMPADAPKLRWQGPLMARGWVLDGGSA